MRECFVPPHTFCICCSVLSLLHCMSVKKDTLRKQLTPALRDLLQEKHRTQKAVDELVDCVAELEGQVSQFEILVKEFTA